MILAEFLPPKPHRLWHLSRQIGVTHAIVKAAPELTGRPHGPYDRDTLASIVKQFDDAGLKVVGLEGDQFDMSRIKLGKPGRDEDLAKYQQMLANMAELGIPLICYNFMAGIGWHRSGATPIRGGAMGTHFRLADVPTTLTDCGEVSAEQMWANYAYFINAVMPVAQRLGIRMGLHPDDPPLSPLRGIARIFSTPGAFDRAHALYPTRSNAITFCQANFKLMGADLAQLATHFGDRIAFIHVRDVRGTPADFVELFHDEMEVDQVTLFKLYRDLKLDVPVRCDHVPTMFEEERDADHIPGYGTMGRLFAVGYFKGVLQAIGARYR
jgi:D-mannonate dehydratase